MPVRRASACPSLFGLLLLTCLLPACEKSDSARTRARTSVDVGSAVMPLDPGTIPQFVEPLSKPLVHVPAFHTTDPSTGERIAHYEVTEKQIDQQLLPHG